MLASHFKKIVAIVIKVDEELQRSFQLSSRK